jgi:hypothetical protein
VQYRSREAADSPPTIVISLRARAEAPDQRDAGGDAGGAAGGAAAAAGGTHESAASRTPFDEVALEDEANAGTLRP